MPLIPDTQARAFDPVLDIRGLGVEFLVEGRSVPTLFDVHLSVAKGKTCALVGESGSGKSVTALSVLRLLSAQAKITGGEIIFAGQDLLGLPPKKLQSVRGGQISMIFQEPMTSLNPLHTIGRQIMEAMTWHHSQYNARLRTLELLDLVGIADAQSYLDRFPHQLSGGQRQRVMIAMALANDPVLLLADEPTTALDVTIQAQVLAVLRDVQQRLGMSILLISHDLGVVRHIADTVYVMRAGRIVESGSTEDIFTHPQEEYTQKLMASRAKGRPHPLEATAPDLVSIADLSVTFPVGRGFFGRPTSFVYGVREASFSLRQGESLGVVGESGSGKTTLGLALLRLISSSGQVIFNGQNLSTLKERQLRSLRRDFQIVFQDPFGSLSPRMTVGQIIAEGLDAHSSLSDTIRQQRIADILEAVELDPKVMHRYPHEFSGGQRQRISIARALVLRPKFIVLDEPTSALDRTVQFQIVELLRSLQKSFALTYLFITHDLALVRALCHRLLIMKEGRIVEQGDTEQIFTRPGHEYTQTLLAAALHG